MPVEAGSLLEKMMEEENRKLSAKLEAADKGAEPTPTPHKEATEGPEPGAELLAEIVSKENQGTETWGNQEPEENTRINLTSEQEKSREQYVQLQQEAAWRIFELRCVQRRIDIRFGNHFREDINIEDLSDTLKENKKYEKKNFGYPERRTETDILAAEELKKARQTALKTLAEKFAAIEKSAKDTDPKELGVETIEEKQKRINNTVEIAQDILNPRGGDAIMGFTKWTSEDFLHLRAALEGMSEYLDFILLGRQSLESKKTLDNGVSFALNFEHLDEIEAIHKQIVHQKQVINELDLKNKASRTGRQMEREFGEGETSYFNQPFENLVSQTGDQNSEETPGHVKSFFTIHQEIGRLRGLLAFVQAEYLAGPTEELELMNDGRYRTGGYLTPGNVDIAWYHKPNAK